MDSFPRCFGTGTPGAAINKSEQGLAPADLEVTQGRSEGPCSRLSTRTGRWPAPWSSSCYALEIGASARAAPRPGGCAFDRVEDHGVRGAPVEDASRFARSPTARELDDPTCAGAASTAPAHVQRMS